MEKLERYDNKKVLVICGFGHLYPQLNRLLGEGFKKNTIHNVSSLFIERARWVTIKYFGKNDNEMLKMPTDSL